MPANRSPPVHPQKSGGGMPANRSPPFTPKKKNDHPRRLHARWEPAVNRWVRPGR